MKLNERWKFKEQACRLVSSSNLFHNPRIDFIMTKRKNHTVQYLIGVTDDNNPEKCFVFKPYAKNKIININDVHYQTKRERELFDDCIEGYLLSCIAHGYELCYMSLAVHLTIWSFIENYLSEVYEFKGTILKYLSFCRNTGITYALILNHYDAPITNLFQFFISDENNNPNIILAHDIGEYFLTFSYDDDPSLENHYTVEIKNVRTDEIKYQKEYPDVQSSSIDFLQQFSSLNVSHYKHCEQKFYEQLNSFVDYIVNYKEHEDYEQSVC